MRRLAWAGWLALGLGGCTTVSTVSEPVVLPDTPVAIRAWSMDGRIGVQSAGKAWQANLYWEHDPAQDRLRLSGPFSQGLVSIVVQKDLIYINEGGGVTALSRDPDAMLRQRLGFAVPLSSLRYWMLGVPDPGASAQRSADAGAGSFRQAGWHIVPDQLASIDGWMLPQKLTVQGAGVKLKILADTWTLRN
ncbi:lipoprotein insertase outer membrane protein LolB [Methyloparacoccus murrellii]|jgi:outer membrane lipoprotein LolB